MQTKIYYLGCFLIIYMVGCSDEKKPVGNKKPQVPVIQARLQDLAVDYKTRYNEADSLHRDSIREEYGNVLHEFLTITPLDSIRVTVRSMEEIGERTLRGTMDVINHVRFYFSINFREIPNEDSIFRFLKGLTIGADTMISFKYFGASEARDLRNSKIPPLWIMAIPKPLDFQLD